MPTESEPEPIERERPNKDNVRRGDLVFIITLGDEVVSAEVTSVRSFKVVVRYGYFIDVFESVPYSKIAFPGVYGGFVMGEAIKKRMLPEAA